MVCGALYLVESGFSVGVETERWRRLEMEMVEGEEDDEDGERCGG